MHVKGFSLSPDIKNCVNLVLPNLVQKTCKIRLLMHNTNSFLKVHELADKSDLLQVHPLMLPSQNNLMFRQ